MKHKTKALPKRVESVTCKSDEELLSMLEEEAAWLFSLPPHEEAHPAPFIGDVLFTLYDEIIRRLRKYSKQPKNQMKGGEE